MVNTAKAEKIKRARIETKQRRENQLPIVYELKICLNNLSEITKQRLFNLFNEAKWLYNYVVADVKNRLKYETYKLKEVEIKVGDEFQKRQVTNLSSQMRQAILERINQSLYALHKSKSNGNRVGELKFKRYINSIQLKQYGCTFKFLNSQKTKVKIQGFKKPFRVLGGHQIPKDCEIAKAELIKKPSGVYLFVTCYVDKDRYVEVWQERIDKNGAVKPREWNSFDTPIGIDLKPNGVVLSNGLKLEWRIEESKRLKRLQRTLAKKQKGSKRWNEVKHQIQREHERLTNIKTDVINKICSLIYRYKAVYLQDDSVKGWQKGQFSKSVHYSAVGIIKRRLSYSLRISTVLLDKYQPTSKTCSVCGHKNEDLTLYDRTFNCPKCESEIDRDLNSAMNMLKFVGLDRSEVKPAEQETAVRILGSNPYILISFLR
ncbi:RNA-guided endonuclease InsQ/TnpB family protein [Pseudothermotoga sp. U03pept]|uniref:RNA-guided endonuclease InsQ/TnpB family protein n=1 Tax=Pseudothermotoga sp. U03pept TaxID=3447012 RepID=UPI003F0D56C5